MKQRSGRLFLTLFFLSFSLTVLSCGKGKQKIHQVADLLADTIHEHIEHVFPSYDADSADTKDNKDRFKEHLQVELTDDVKDLYTYGDFMGIDYSVLMSFTCEQTTIDRIIKRNGLHLSFEGDNGFVLQPNLNWWKRDSINQLIPYKAGEEDEFFQYLWYNPVTKRAFYQEFTM